MLKQGSVADLRSGKLTRAQGYIVVAMAFYPRGLKKDLLDEYRTHLAPDRELFREWKEAEEKHGHDEAFRITDYENRFTLPPDALESLRRLVDLSRTRDVYLICQCELGQRCHREMVALFAATRFGAEIAPLHHQYPAYAARIAAPKAAAKA